MVAVDTLAYQYTQPPPSITRPRPNVIIRLCDIQVRGDRAVASWRLAWWRHVGFVVAACLRLAHCMVVAWWLVWWLRFR